MPIFDVRCVTCGWSAEDRYETSERKTLCPEGHATVHVWQTNRSAVVIGDDPFIGGVTFHNLDHNPVTVYSRAQLKREMDARGLEPMVRHQPTQGSDKSPMTTRWI
jgi:hypothetical protein